MLPEYPQFKTLEFEDCKLINKYLNLARRKICELNLANIFTYKDSEHPRFTFINRNLCFYLSPSTEAPYFLEPLSKNKIPETVDICLKHAGKISRVSEDFIARLPRRPYCFSDLRSQFDYVYLQQKLAELKGKKFDGKRNHIEKFKHRFPEYKFIPLNANFKKQALKLFEEWFAIRKEARTFVKLNYTSQKEALKTAFSYFDKFDFYGGAIAVNEKLKGFILGSPLTQETISVHFLYGHPAALGITQILLWEACNKAFSSFKYVNLEQDLGIPGLRKAKLSYHPLQLEKKFEIKPVS